MSRVASHRLGNLILIFTLSENKLHYTFQFSSNIFVALSRSEAVCPIRWRAGSRNSVTQRFKKDSFIIYKNFLKLPNSCNPLTSFEVKNAMFITLIFFLASISLNFDLNSLHFSIKIEWNSCQIQFPIEKTFQMRYWWSWTNKFENIWPKTSILYFEIWIILRLLKTFLAKLTYHWLFYCIRNISQDKSVSFYH